MKLIIIDCSPYKPLDYYFSKHGKHYYLVPEEEVEGFRALFEAWRQALGPCLEARKEEPHPAGEHVWIEDVVDVDELPPVLKRVG